VTPENHAKLDAAVSKADALTRRLDGWRRRQGDHKHGKVAHVKSDAVSESEAVSRFKRLNPGAKKKTIGGSVYFVVDKGERLYFWRLQEAKYGGQPSYSVEFAYYKANPNFGPRPSSSAEVRRTQKRLSEDHKAEVLAARKEAARRKDSSSKTT
jgi:hypothetical protein